MKVIIRCLIALLLICWIAPAHADVIYDNGANVSGGGSDFDFPLFIADDFMLVPGMNTITDVHWTGLYDFSNTPQPDNFTIEFYADASGLPAVSPLITIPIIGNAGRTDLGGGLFSYSVNIAPLTLNANTPFWLSIFNNTTADTDDDWFWGVEQASGVGTFAFRNNTNSPNVWNSFGDARLDFQLTNDAVVPEPSSLALLGIGLAGLALARKLRRG